MECYDLFIVGGGAAGLSAARAAAEQGCGRILLAERDAAPGGTLRQCLHKGFGPELSGPDYIRSLMADFPGSVALSLNTCVLSVNADRTAVLSAPDFGLKQIRFRRMILAAGCREIPMGRLRIAGTRPEGIYTAGELQRRMNLHGFVPEGPAVILGGGDMGQIIAWQLLEAGVEIAMLAEQRERCTGRAPNRNRLEGCALPLRTGATVSRVFGQDRLEGVSVRELERGAETCVPCRTLVIAAGLLPDRDLIRTLGQPHWLQLCGNCSRIHSVVEGVVQEGIQAGRTACKELKG